MIPLADVTLVDDISTDPQCLLASVTEEETSEDTNSIMTESRNGDTDAYLNRLFRLLVEPRDQPSYAVTFVANDENQKCEWCSDIAQCLQNLRYSDLLTGTFRNESSVMAPESVK